jgi:hypothetical protein
MAENKPIASTKAKAKIDNENNSDFKEGFLAVPFINAANTNPAPVAAPANPIDEIPAPINFAASIILDILIILLINIFEYLYIY